MPLQNLEQVRAKHALAYSKADLNTGGQNGGKVMKKIPAAIMNNGLLAAAAFALDPKHREKGWGTAFDHITLHLASSEIGLLDKNDATLEDLLMRLTESDSHTLKLATQEALAWLAYARRFVTGGGEDDE